MRADPAAGAAVRADREPLRFALPVLLLAAEFAVLSLLVDFPVSGPSAALATAARMLVPAVLGAGAAGILIARHHRSAFAHELRSLAAPRPWPALGAHLAAFGVTAAFAYRLMRPGAPPVPVVAFVAWLTCVAVTVTLAAAIVASPVSLARLAARRLAAPLFALGVGLLCWRAALAANDLWGVLQGGTLGAAAWLIGLVAGPVEASRTASTLRLGSFYVAVAPVCSGADGVGLVVLFQAVWLSLARDRVRVGRALAVLVPAGIVAALAANVLRISVLVLAGAAGHEDLAIGAFHSKLGWLLFIGIAFTSIAAAEHVAWLRKDAPGSTEGGLPPAVAAYVAPLLAALATALVTSLWASGGFDAMYGARVVAAGLVLIALRRRLPRMAWSPSWVPFALAAIVTAFWVPLAGVTGSTLADTVGRLAPGARAAWIALRLLGACLVLPVAEELAFRGFLLPWLVSPDLEGPSVRCWSWPAILLSSLAFGAIHEQWMLGTAAGIVFAFARVWRGKLGDAIVAHVACNAAVSLVVVFAGRWDLWG